MPRKQPARLRLLNGSQPSKISRSEPQPRPALPVAPDGIPDEVRAVFDDAVANLDDMRLAASADAEALLVYCWAVVNHSLAADMVSRDGIVIEGAMGGRSKHPGLQIMRDSAATIRSYAQEFGLTPAARAGLKVGGSGGDGANPFDVETVS